MQQLPVLHAKCLFVCQIFLLVKVKSTKCILKTVKALSILFGVKTQPLLFYFIGILLWSYPLNSNKLTNAHFCGSVDTAYKVCRIEKETACCNNDNLSWCTI